ncbi:MAG: DNA polymerase I, partial [Clostridiaceae bacterium]
MKKERIVILDGNSLMNRAYYAIRVLTNSEGINTNAILGFSNMLFKIKDDFKPDSIVCTFDRKAPTFRHKEYDAYKAGRKKMPPELYEQFPILKDMLTMMSINIFEIDGFEADDIIGTLSKYASNKGIEVFIVTGDKDALQLAEKDVNVIITKKGISEIEIYNEERMIEEFGVTPKEFIDVKGLMGDKSDNIPGVPGIGEKTAFNLIKEYKSVENVLDNIENLKGKKLKENLLEYREQAIFSKKLATIVCDVPVDIDLEDIRSNDKYDVEGLRKLFFRLQFKRLLDKLPAEEKIMDKKQVEFKKVESLEDLENINKDIEDILYFNYDEENLYLNIKDNVYLINVNEMIQENQERFINILKNIFENKDINIVVHDLKKFISIMKKIEINIKNQTFDTMIAAYLIDPSRTNYNLKDLIEQNLFIDLEGNENIIAAETYYLKELYLNLKENLDKMELKNLFYNVEMPLVKVLSSMEGLGFNINKEELDRLSVKFREDIEKNKKIIYEIAGEEFNISSPKQLSVILFEKLDLPVIKKTKTGASTNAEVLDKLLDKHPIIEKIIYYRQLTKLYSTYVEGLRTVIAEDGKIHTNFNQAKTTTGRLSSTEPNLQNIPIKYEMGRAIRKVFIPDNENCVLLSADYSQIELRVLAHIAKDDNFITAFNEHDDIHTKTASEVFNVEIDEVTPLLRGRAKAVNFGIVYGIGDFSLAKDLKISKKEAKLYIDTYFERYPKVKIYLDEVINKTKEDGYVTTILKRRRYIPEINSSNKIVKALGERLAMNTPIQGSAADIIKIAMINVYNRLNEESLKSTLILQVHDELILNVYKDELEKVKEIVKYEM